MQTQRRYVVRLYGKGSAFGGILEDARTGVETPFKGARELVSLLHKSSLTSFQSPLPSCATSVTTVRGRTRQFKRKAKKEGKT